MARNIIVGLDVGTSAIKIIAAEKNPGGELHILGVTQKSSSGVKRGYVADPEAVANAVRNATKELERITSVPIKHAYLSIGGIKLESQRARGNVIVSRADGEISASDVKRAINQAESNLSKTVNRTIIHRIPVAFKVDGEIVMARPTGMKGEKLEADVLFITCFSQHFNDLVKSVENAGIIIDDIAGSPIAASCSALNKRQKEVGAILVEMGAETTSIAIFEEGGLISLEVFPFGSNHITNDIAIGLQISLEAAEDLKFNYVSDNQKRKLADIIEARMDDIFELIEAHLKKIGRNELLPAGVILTGGGANLSNIENLAKTSLRLPSRIGTPIVLLKVHDKQIYNPKWAVSLGLCAMASDNNMNPDPTEGSSFGKPKNPLTSWLFKWMKSFLP